MKTTTYQLGTFEISFYPETIKKNFWFAEDARTTEEWDEVCQKVEDARNEAYFISENLNGTTAARYLRCLDDRKYVLYAYEGKGFVEPVRRCIDRPSYAGAHELTEDEREQLRAICEAEQAKYEKRLRSYLKRYGLSKCQFSTFWANR